MPTVLITGANRGIGLEFVRQYLMDGWRVFAACRRPSTANELRGLAHGEDKALTIFPMDVTDAQSVREATRLLEDEAIDVLVNCAGIAGASGQKVGNLDYQSWAHVLDVNTMGPLRVLEAFTDHIARSDRKLAVTLTSGMGSIADNRSGGSLAYRTSKAAVNMAMRTAAIDLASRAITCVVINPGWVRTDMGGPGATSTPEQSVAAMRKLIERLGPEDSGKFYNYNGREYPW
jgi:NAD(P)-dependent dehydrogenase (short-subunit alcohol dehydrogenase family)